MYVGHAQDMLLLEVASALRVGYFMGILIMSLN